VATGSKGGDATPRPVAQTPRGACAAATPATAPRGSVDGALPLRIPFQAEKKGKSPQGRADGTRCKGSGIVNAAIAASALRSTQNNTVLLADLLRRLAVQGTVLPVGGKGTAQHWVASIGLVVCGGLGMPDVHGRPAARDIKAAGDCDHAHVRVVTASDVHFSRAQTIDVLEQVLQAVRQDAVDRPSPPDAGGRYRPRVLTQQVRCCFCRRRPATVKCAVGAYVSHERQPVWPCRFLYVQALLLGFCTQETAWPDGCALMRYGPSKMDRAATRAATPVAHESCSTQSHKILLKKLIFSELFRGFSHTLGSPLPCTTLAPVRRRLGG